MTHGEVTKDILDLGTESSLGTIAKEATGGTIEANKVLESGVDLSFRMHGKTSSKFTLDSTVQLQHGTASMAWKTIIMGRSIREDGISGNKFITAGDISTGETGAIVATHGETTFGLVPLGSVTNSITNAINRGPTKKGTKKFVVRLVRQNGFRLINSDMFIKKTEATTKVIIMGHGGIIGRLKWLTITTSNMQGGRG